MSGRAYSRRTLRHCERSFDADLTSPRNVYKIRVIRSQMILHYLKVHSLGQDDFPADHSRKVVLSPTPYVQAR